MATLGEYLGSAATILNAGAAGVERIAQANANIQGLKVSASVIQQQPMQRRISTGEIVGVTLVVGVIVVVVAVLVKGR